MANKNVILDLSGKIVTILNEGQDPSPFLVDGARNIIVPASYLSNAVNEQFANLAAKPDPRTELKLTMQTGTRGTGCTAGVTSGVTGCGRYNWNETVFQNISTVDARKRTDTSAVTYNPDVKRFGTASARFNGAIGGSSGGVLLLNDLPGLTLAGRGGHVGGGSGASGAGVSGGYSGDVLIKFWFNLDSIAGANDMVLLTQGNTSGGGTGNSWKLYWHASANALKFAFNNQGDTPTTTYTHSATIADQTKVTAGQWHHCAVIYKSRWFGSNGSEVVTYFNGASAGSVKTDVAGELLRSDQPVAIGAFKNGYYPMTGYMDDFHMMMGPSGGTVCRGYSGPSYSTAGISGGATLDSYASLALMRFNGPSGCELFSVDNYEKIKAKVTYWNGTDKVLGVRDIVLTGNVANGFNYAYGLIEGFAGNGHFQLSCTGGTYMSGTEKRAMKNGQFRQAMNEYFGLVGVSGNSGSSGDAPREGGTPGMANLFGPHSGAGHGEPNFHGVHTTGYSTRTSDGKMNEIKEIVEFINTDGGTPGCGVDNFTLQDTLSNAVGFSPGHCFALFQDMFGFRRDVQEQVIDATVEVNAASTADANSYSEISSILLNSTITKYTPDGYDSEGSSRYGSKTINFSSGVNSEETSGGGPPREGKG